MTTERDVWKSLAKLGLEAMARSRMDPQDRSVLLCELALAVKWTLNGMPASHCCQRKSYNAATVDLNRQGVDLTCSGSE